MIKGVLKKKRKYFSIMLVPHSRGKVKTLKIRNIVPILGLVIIILCISFGVYSYSQLGLEIVDLISKNEQLGNDIISLCDSEKIQRKLISEKSTEINNLLQHKDKVTATITEFGNEYDNMVKTFLRGRFETGISSRAEGNEEQSINFVAQSKELYTLLSDMNTLSIVEEDGLDDIQDVSANLKEYLDTLPTFWPAEGALFDTFGWRIHPIKKYRIFHDGLDMGGSYNQPIYAAGNGTVIFSGYNSGYGHTITIEHIFENRVHLFTTYSHLKKRIAVEGQVVKRGEQIALMGSSGLSTGPHLHFEVHLPNHTKIDPLYYLDKNEKK